MTKKTVDKLLASVLAFGFGIACGGCSTISRAVPPKNAVDYLYSSRPVAASDPWVQTYQKGFSGILFAECHWLPSDSEFLRRAAARCGTFRATYLAVARFLAEPDLARSEPNAPIFYADRLRWVENAPTCD